MSSICKPRDVDRMINEVIRRIKKEKNKFKNVIRCKTQLKSIITCDLAADLPISTHIPHPYGVVVGYHVEMGENCAVRQGVTIGAVVQRAGYPKIGNNVNIGANSLILGDITIGDNAIIGAGSVIVKHIPERCVAVGNPAKVIKKIAVKNDGV